MARAKRKKPPKRPRAPPRARMEFVDVATGEPVRPAPPHRAEGDGSAPTGRVVAELEGVEIEIDDEDLLAGEGEHPRERTYGFDLEGPTPDYREQAAAKAVELGRARARLPPKKPRAFRATFDSPREAARDFYEANALFFDNVPDPVDGLREWADGIDVRTGRQTSRRLINTSAGRRILEARQGAPQILAALRWTFQQAAGRRWDAVPWHEIDRLEEALQPLYEAPSEREAGTPGIYWRPVVGDATREQLDELAPETRVELEQWESAEEIRLALSELREAYAENLDCIPPELRAIVERRIVEWNRWARDPAEIPDYACEPDPRTGGYTCDYPSVAGELLELRGACKRSYDPDWAEPQSRAGALGYPDTSGGPNDPRLEPLAEALAAPEPVQLELEELRQLTDDGRAYGASTPAIVERREEGEILYQLEFRTCGKRRPDGTLRCSCAEVFPHGGHGPYWYAYWRDGGSGRRVSAYIGKEFREVR